MFSSIFVFLVLSSPFWPPSSALYSFREPAFQSIKTHEWSNNASITDVIVYEDGSLARLILKTEGNDSCLLPPFGCGFICNGNCSASFFGILILGGAKSSVVNQQVWLANREKPIRENGRLEFTVNGGLVLRDSDGTFVWSTGNSSKSLVGIKLGEDGNLQLYNHNHTVVWNSFGEPSDTLLPGQKLYKEAKLIASASAKNWSGGQYYIQMISDGFTAFFRADVPIRYLQLGMDIEINFIEAEQSPTSYTLHDGNNLLIINGESNYSFPISPKPDARSYHFLMLDFDGHLRTYRWQKNKSMEEVYDFITREMDDCQYPYVCGGYGVCNRGGKCSCPKALDVMGYFKQNEGRSSDRGCSENIPLSCRSPLDRHRMVDFGNLSYFSFIDNQAAISYVTELNGCKQTCQKDCTCRAAFFKYVSDISYGQCYLLSEVLSIRADPVPGVSPYHSSAFIKVQLPYSPPTQPPVNSPPSRTALHQTSRRKTNLPAILSASLASVFALLLFVLGVVISIKKRKTKKAKARETERADYFNPVLRTPKRFSYEELCVATEDFKDRLGGGGFGSVFRGALEDGTRIAVKRLDNRGQGMKEFLAEVETMGNIHHFNLVRLIGFCAEESCQLLVYEFMSNGSLDTWIFNSQRNREIEWQTRKKIVLGIAKGLTYLHDECLQRIIHLDIKPHNILLDDNFNAKVSDFGLSKQMDRDQSQVQITMQGTPGYITPEWRQLRVSLKFDIYSFGIVVLETVCGRRNFDSSRSESSQHLLRLLQEKAEADRLLDIVEGPSTEMQLHGDEVLKMIQLSSWCLQDDHTRRPQMSVVVKVLEGAMEVEPNISYRFCNAMTHTSASVSSSDAPQASVLSGPR